MIRANRSQNNIEVTGHAGYAPKGWDIVCAGVSGVVLTFLESASEYCRQDLSYEMPESGNVVIKITDSEQIQFLASCLFIGLRAIEREFPEYIKVTEH